MAVYRPIQISYWQDSYVLKLTPEQKFFYIYLMTNSKTFQCGIYELPLGIISIETGYNEESIKKLIHKFILDKKIKYDFENEIIYLINWIRYNQINNVNIFKCVINELKSCKNKKFVQEFMQNLNSLNTNNDYNLQIQATMKGLFKKSKGLPSIKTETESESKTEEETETEEGFRDKYKHIPFIDLFLDNLQTPEFVETWTEWINYRKSIKHSIVESTAKMQLKKLAEHQKDAIEIINKSISNGWQGLFYDLSKNGKQTASKMGQSLQNFDD